MIGINKTVIGLDVGSFSVKAVALAANRDRLTLQGFAAARIGSEEPVAVIRKVLDQLNIKSPRIVTAVSGRSVIVRQVETPRLPPEELKAHIAYEADKYIPFGSEEVIIDCQPLPDRADAAATTMQVLLVAVRRGFVEDHIAQLRAAGVLPEVIDVDVFALSNAYELLGPGPQAEGEASATALIDIGASKSNIAIVQASRLLFTREIYLAGNEITDAIVRVFNEPAEDIERLKTAPGEALENLIDAAMPALEDLANEIRLSFDYVEGQFEAQVANVVLSGGSSQLAGLSEILGTILARPVHIMDPLAGLDLVPSKYDIHALDGASPSLAVALGLAAHLLSFSQTGLGGAAAHAWQPRQVRTDGDLVRAAIGHAQHSDHAPPPLTDPEPATFTPPSYAPPSPPPSFVPPPIATSQFRPPATAPVARVAPLVTPAPAIADDLDVALPDDLIAGSSDTPIPESQRSGLLVVLDEDQEMPPSERHDVSSVRRSGILKVESFEEEDDQGSRTALPELPKL
jgi:type IV pilus assembly protein PilM